MSLLTGRKQKDRSLPQDPLRWSHLGSLRLLAGRSFVGLLVARQNIHIAYGILGSSDLDQASPLAAKLQADFLLPLIVPVVWDGKLKVNFLQKRLDKHARELGDCVKAFLKMFGEARPYMTGRKLSTV